MSTVARELQWPTTVALGVAILISRIGHFGTFETPPDATLAACFLAGLWVRGVWAFVLLLAAAGAADQIAFAQGVSDWCVSSAYGFLIPAYGCPWLAGMASRSLDWRRPRDLLRGASYLLVSLAASFAISSGSFFLLADYFSGMSAQEYWSAAIAYLPRYIAWALVYSAAAIVTREAVVAALGRPARNARAR